MRFGSDTVETKAVFELPAGVGVISATFAFAAARSVFALAGVTVGETEGDGVGDTLGVAVGVGLASVLPAPIVTAAVALSVRGGRQTSLLQAWKRKFAVSVCSPGGASDATVNGTVKVAEPEYVSVLILKLSSNLTFGFGPLRPPIAKIPGSIVIFVGYGPPAPWVTEYMYHGAEIEAVSFTVPFPPGAIADGETLADTVTGACADAMKAEAARTTAGTKA